MAVPLLDLKPQHNALSAELHEAFERVMRSGFYILGQEVQNFEQALREYTGAAYAVGLSSGTDALIVALMAAGVGPGDEVLCPTYSFFATAGSVARLGAIPVFVDVCADSFNVDVEDAKKKVTARTRAIIPVHLFGQCADMDAVAAFAQAHGLFVIEDAAQSFGAQFRGRMSGLMSDVGTYSFFPTKNLGGLGDSGALVTHSASLYEKVVSLRNHGMSPKYYHQRVGGNFRIDALQAALLAVKLRHLDSYAALRQQNAAYYSEQLLKLDGVDLFCDLSEKTRIVIPAAQPNNTHVWNQYTLRILGDQRRDACVQHMRTQDIGTEIYYPLCLHEQECFQNNARGGESIRVAQQLSQQAVSIPIYPELSLEQKNEVIAAIARFLEGDEIL